MIQETEKEQRLNENKRGEENWREGVEEQCRQKDGTDDSDKNRRQKDNQQRRNKDQGEDHK